MMLTPLKINPLTNRGGVFTTKSLYIDGVDEAVNIDSALTSLSTANTATISIWVKPIDGTPLSTEQFLCFGDTNANTSIRLGVLNTGVFDFQIRLGGTIQWIRRTDSAVFTDNTWTHLAVVMDNGAANPILYVNGVAVAQSDLTTTNNYCFNDLTGLDNGRIGCLNHNSGGNINFFDGKITDVLFTSDAKTAGNISTIYNSGTPKDEASISNGVSYHRMGNASGDNWNSGVASEWQFIDQIGSNNGYTINCEEADVQNDAP
jgi:hypothetical protein